MSHRTGSGELTKEGGPGRSLSRLARRLLGALLLAWSACWCCPPAFGARMALLPVRDFTGDPASVAVLVAALQAELSAEYELADSELLRDALRRWRIRDARSVPPELLRRVADELGVDWFFAVTLHRCDLEPLPMVTVSGQAMHRGEPRLAWAGFQSVTAMDEVGLLGRGWVGDLDALEQKAAGRLAGSFARRAEPRRKSPRPASRLFRREALDLGSAGTIAVLPFGGATGVGATNAGLMVTDLACAVLWQCGASLALPGAVDELLGQAGVGLRGGIDELTRSALLEELEAGLLFTGTVETFEFIQQGAEPEPAVALAVWLIETRTGRLLAYGGSEREGWDRQRLFGRGRVHSPERLAELIMESLVADLGEKGGY
jgi:hypothetical protein